MRRERIQIPKPKARRRQTDVSNPFVLDPASRLRVVRLRKALDEGGRRIEDLLTDAV
jgi:hypothetical protein